MVIYSKFAKYSSYTYMYLQITYRFSYLQDGSSYVLEPACCCFCSQPINNRGQRGVLM